jgi:hypothetical protein
MYHCMKVNTDSNQIEHGSWFKGKLYHYRCDLSHDGELMVYLAMGSKGETWNGVCRVPWLKCMYQWDTMGTWHGGGLWKSKRRLVRNLGISTDRANVNKEFEDPAQIQFEVHSTKYGEDEGVLYDRLKRDGWVRQGDFGKDRELRGKNYEFAHDGDSGWLLKGKDGWADIRMYYRGYMRGRVFEFVFDDHPDFFNSSDDWATFDSLNQLWVARGGCVEKWTINDFEMGKPSFVIDLNKMTLDVGCPDSPSSVQSSS